MTTSLLLCVCDIATAMESLVEHSRARSTISIGVVTFSSWWAGAPSSISGRPPYSFIGPHPPGRSALHASTTADSDDLPF